MIMEITTMSLEAKRKRASVCTTEWPECEARILSTRSLNELPHLFTGMTRLFEN